MKILQGAQFEVFLPLIRGVSSLKPLFPSYLFIRTNFQSTQTYRFVHFTRGVQRILGDEGAPSPIADEIMISVKLMTKNNSIIERDLLFQEGDEVFVKKGVLKDLQVIIEKKIADENRIQILYKWLNTTMRAEVKYTDVEAA